MNPLRSRRAPLVAGILVIVGLAAALTLYRSSPGELSEPHASVAGMSIITSCNKCHAPQGLTAGCMSCHKEIEAQLKTKAGFHHLLSKTEEMRCDRCHREHLGRAFQLVNAASWKGRDPEKFDHPHVDFKLSGKHAALKCDACHAREGNAKVTLPDFPDRPRRHTFMGLSQQCASCHKDIHAGGLASRCDQCHNQQTFKPASGFDHSRFFPLTGGHAGVDCAKCHVIPAQAAPGAAMESLFKRVRGKSCQECHASPHRADWKQSCDACHSASAPWSAASKGMTAKIHARTGFKLEFPHHQVSCQECHRSGSFAEKYPDPSAPNYKRGAQSCEGCHRDPHRGQFADKHPRCITCHTSAGFSPARFGTREHDAFPLKGAHAAVPCIFCHTADAGGVRKFAGVPHDCASCHKDEHRGQFAQNGQTRCERCHDSASNWKAGAFDHNRDARLRLDEAHADVKCAQCHFRVRVSGGQMTRFKPLKMECKDCHVLDSRSR